MGRGGVRSRGCLVLGGAWYWGGAWSQGVLGGLGGGVWGWDFGGLVQGGCMVMGFLSRGVPGRDHPGTATAVGSTHPTGMHSCFLSCLTNNVEDLLKVA